MDFNVEDKSNDGMVDNTDIPMEQAGQMDTNNDGKISSEKYEQSVRSSPLGQQYEYTYGHPWNMQTKNWDIDKKYPSDVWAKEYNIQEPEEPQYNPNYDRWHSWKPSDLTEALKEGNEEKAEQITEEAPEMAAVTVPDTPLATEAEQITNDTDKRNDEVNNTAVKDTVEMFNDPIKEMVNRDTSANLPATTEQLADVEEATPEEEEKWNNHFNTGTTALTVPGQTATELFQSIMNGTPKTPMLEGTSAALGLPAPHIPQTETEGQLEPIKPGPKVAIGTDEIDPLPPSPIGDKKDWKLKLPHFYIPLNIEGAPQSEFGFDYKKGSSIPYESAKSILRSLGSGGKGGYLSTDVGGVHSKDFTPDVEGASYSKGHEDKLPETGRATSSTGPTTKLFNDIMSGKGRGGSTPFQTGDKKTMAKGRHLSLKGKGKLGQMSPMGPMKLPSGGKGSDISANRNGIIFKKLHEFIRHNFQHWKHNKHGYVWERGAISIYVNDSGITIKYGSYIRDTLEIFAKEHPDLLINVAKEIGV